ncbi:MAG: alginate O-acetyltransferase AlgX-related protein [Thermoanaerobaculia bacterium]
MSRPRRRARWAISAAVVVLAALTILGLMAREIVPGSTELTNRLFALALPLTYVGLWASLILVSRTPRTMLVRGLVITFTVVLVLLILEIPAGLGWVHWTVVFRRLNGEAADYGTAYVHDAELSFRRIPGLTWTTRPLSDVEQGSGLPPAATERITFTYDRWGYRNAEEMEHAEIVLLGDSYVEGWYVSDEQTVATRLAARLGRSVANLGVAGYGTLQELRVLESDALARRPRTVVWFFFEGNDLYDDQTFENSRLADPPSPPETVPHPEGLATAHGWKERSLALNALRRLRRWSHPLIPNRAPYWALLPGRSGAAARIYFADYAAVPWTEFEAARWATTKAAFDEGLAFAATRGMDLVFVYIPIKYRVYRHVIEVPPDSPIRSWRVWTELPELFRAFCASARAPCLDLTAPFERAARRGAMVYARTDTHWSAKGHDLVAAEIEAVLRRQGSRLSTGRR